MPEYRKFDLLHDARLVHGYLTRMVDPARDFLPYWLIGANENPAWAQHCRVDDAELVASWSEALVCTMEMLGTEDGRDVLAGFRRHLLRSWGEHGLRFHEEYPWTATVHSSFHEMGYVLAALVRWLRLEPDHAEVRRRMVELIHGMHGLAVKLEMRTFWAGDFPFEETICKFPNDVYIRGKGFDLTRCTGRGEESIRNAVILYPLVEAWELTGDEKARELAMGTANYMLGPSRYFNWKREFFGHVHSAVWIAAGLVRLGRLVDEPWYVKCGKQIVDYVLSLSSSFGWVPEYAQWHPMCEEHSETCCIRDVILAGIELVDAGYPEYWDVINRFARNHLSEQQIKSGAFVGVDNSLADTEDMTFKDMDKRIVGGYSGGGLPNSVSLSKFRSIAGCCVGTAPQALHQVWENIIRETPNGTEVNLPIDCDHAAATVTCGYPNAGWLRIVPKRGGPVRIRIHPFMDRDLTLLVDGKGTEPAISGACVFLDTVNAGADILLRHSLDEETRDEEVAGQTYSVTWRGADVVRILPEGEPLRLYQRLADVPLDVPGPPLRMSGTPKGFDARPTEQKR